MSSIEPSNAAIGCIETRMPHCRVWNMNRLGLLVGLALAMGCEQSKPAPQSAPSAPSARDSIAAAPPAASSAAPKAAPKVGDVRMKPPGKPAALGTLPKGIGIRVGEAAPSAKLKNYQNEDIELSSQWKKRRVLLVFYRGGWCPFCNFQIREFTKQAGDLRKRDLNVVFVSVDRPSEATKSRDHHDLPFQFLSDSDLVLHKAYKVGFRVDDATLKRLKEKGIDIERSSGKDHHTVAVPSLFLIDKGKVKWAHADTDYKKRPKLSKVLDAIDAGI